MTTTVPATAKSIWVDLLGAEVRYYDAAGIRTRSIESGTGETIIMLHGIGGHAEAFARNVVPLGEHFNARSIDYYGHGFTDYGGKPFVKDTYVRHLIDFMDAAGIKKAHLIGESLGGWIAAWAAIDYPDRVGKVIYTGQAELTRLSKQFMAEPNRANVHARLKWLFYKPDRDINDELIDLRWALYQRALGKPNPASSLGTTESELTPEVLARIPRPMLFLWTDHNPSQQAKTAKAAMQYVKDAEWAMIEDAGHWPQWEHPDEFNRIVTAYLNK